MLFSLLQGFQSYIVSHQAQTLVKQGWASNMEEVVNESLRRYLESHQDVLTESFIQEDIEWGLHGSN